MISHRVKRPASLASCMLATLSMASIASAQSGPMPSAMPIGELKRTYLECERAAVAGGLGGGDTMRCSVVYEELKRRAFGNDFRLLKAWSDSQLRPVSVSHATVATA